jgi:hypothetical protein
LGWNEPTSKSDKLYSIIAALTLESEEDAEARREKQKWDNYVPASERRPLDEFYYVDDIESQCLQGPVDVSIDTNDVVHYMHETRYSNGQLVDFEEKRKAKEKFEMANL